MAVTTAIGIGAACIPSHAQTWDYKAYKKTRTGQFHKDEFTMGTISLEEKEGKSFFSMNAGGVDVCWRGNIPANVTRSETVTTIEVQQPIAGCELTRYVIRNDGTGGDREFKRGDNWVKDHWDHQLTLKK